MGKDLRTMIRNSFMPLNYEQEGSIRAVFKEWLKQVSLPHLDSEESTRQLLIHLVDEPE
ncbi:hypothetical protein LCGC14_1314070 [marine sediment metagenome]|uniref:Uncharacterized protein n=1 Tax=marine sediment metagenome TaxID=412755 RepID=A0A0F9NNV1_9ZZZZ